MKKKPNTFLLFLFISISNFCLGQQITQDLVSPWLIEEFQTNKNGWPVSTTADNLFIVQDGFYTLYRSNTSSQYVIFNDKPVAPEKYQLETGFSFEKSGSQHSFGLLFLTQTNGGGFVLEINSEKKYRIKELINAENFKLQTGTQSNEGWVKSKALKEGPVINKIKIKVGNNSADIYLNNEFISTVSNPVYKPGKYGFIIGPETKVKVDYLYIYGPEVIREQKPLSKTNQTSNAPDTASDCCKVTKRLDEQLKRSNSELRKFKEAALSDTTKDHIENLKLQVKTLEKEIRDLKKAPKNNSVAENTSETDVIISISKVLEKERIEKEKYKALYERLLKERK